MSDTGQERCGLYTLHWEAWTDYERVTLARIEIHVNGRELMHARASATCHPDDSFNKAVGQQLAVARATAKCFAHLDASLAQLHRAERKMVRSAYNSVNRQEKLKAEDWTDGDAEAAFDYLPQRQL